MPCTNSTGGCAESVGPNSRYSIVAPCNLTCGMSATLLINLRTLGMKVTCSLYESQRIARPRAGPRRNAPRPPGRGCSRRAGRLFAADGYAAVPTQAIVDAAGVTRGALYHQFGDKSGLFAEVYEEVERDLVTAHQRAHRWRPNPSTSWRRCALGARLFLAECSAPDVQRIVLIDAPAVLGWERWREVGMKYGLGVIEAMLAQAMADGVIPDAAAAPDGARAARRARRGGPVRVEGRRCRRGAARRCTRCATV